MWKGCIFEEIKDRLYAVAYDDTRESILTTLQDKWSDVVWLEEFFEANKQDLESGFYAPTTIDEAIEITLDEADELFAELLEQDGSNLDQLFRPLDNREYSTKDFQEQKAKGNNRSWLRIYAVHYYDRYIITGGAIKLTHQMEDRPHTQEELRKLSLVRSLLKYDEGSIEFVYLDIEKDE